MCLASCQSTDPPASLLDPPAAASRCQSCALGRPQRLPPPWHPLVGSRPWSCSAAPHRQPVLCCWLASTQMQPMRSCKSMQSMHHSHVHLPAACTLTRTRQVPPCTQHRWALLRRSHQGERNYAEGASRGGAPRPRASCSIVRPIEGGGTRGRGLLAAHAARCTRNRRGQRRV
jgi:hypothetical protein